MANRSALIPPGDAPNVTAGLIGVRLIRFPGKCNQEPPSADNRPHDVLSFPLARIGSNR